VDDEGWLEGGDDSLLLGFELVEKLNGLFGFLELGLLFFLFFDHFGHALDLAVYQFQPRF